VHRAALLIRPTAERHLRFGQSPDTELTLSADPKMLTPPPDDDHL
jgi:hypothetical protein